MKYLYHKNLLYGKWVHDECKPSDFSEGENPSDFTEKIPPHAGVVFDEGTGEWVVKEGGGNG